MKTLLIIRHAKSSSALPGQADKDRSLSPEGIAEAEVMARKVMHRINKIDLFIASSARRTRNTAEKFMEIFKAGEKILQTENALYESSMDAYYDILELVEDDKEVVAIFGHNPGITYFVHSHGCADVFDMPAGSVFALTFDADSWQKIRASKRKMLFFYQPGER